MQSIIPEDENVVPKTLSLFKNTKKTQEVLPHCALNFFAALSYLRDIFFYALINCDTVFSSAKRAAVLINAK